MAFAGLLLRCGPFLALAWLGAAAHAQIPTSTQDRVTHRDPQRGDAARTDPVFRRTIACVVERQPGSARNLMRTIPGTRAESLILANFRSRLDWCYNSHHDLGFAWNLVRGGIAELYYHRAFPAGLPAGSAPDATLAAAWSGPRDTGGRAGQMEMLHSTARCVVLRNPRLVSDMLAAAPFSPAEMRAIRSLRGDLSACLNTGIEFTASRQSLRGLLAEAALLYGEAQRGGFGHASAAAPPSN